MLKLFLGRPVYDFVLGSTSCSICHIVGANLSIGDKVEIHLKAADNYLTRSHVFHRWISDITDAEVFDEDFVICSLTLQAVPLELSAKNLGWELQV